MNPIYKTVLVCLLSGGIGVAIGDTINRGINRGSFINLAVASGFIAPSLLWLLRSKEPG